LKPSRLDVYDYDRRLERYYANIHRRPDLLPAHKRAILEFDRWLQGGGLSKPRRLTYLQTLPQVAKMLGKPFEEAAREDLRRVVAQLDRNGYTGETKESYKAVIKRFYRWLRHGDDEEAGYPPEVRWIKIRSGYGGNRLPEDLPTDEEVRALAEAAGGDLRDRAFVELLDDFGGRPAELLTLRLRHVVFDEYGAVVLVDGKTGQRRVRVIQSAPALANWVSHHPMKGRPEAPLWLKRRQNGGYGGPLDYVGANALLKRLCEKARLRRRLRMYDFRHRRATKYANILTEEQMDEYFGWVKGSRQPRRYVHLSGRDIDPALLRAHGFQVPEGEAGRQQPPQECSRCHARNSPLARFCHRCGLALDLQAALDHDRKTPGDLQTLKAEVSALKEELARQKAFEEYVLQCLKEKAQ
jgi:site-specific recombinase XerD